MRTSLFFLILLLPGLARAQIEWRVSVKFILDGSNNRPASGNVATDNQVRAQIDTGNAILDKYSRGYRLRLTEIVDLSGVSQWFNVDSRSASNKMALEQAAVASPGLYAYRSDAVNIYINGFGNTAVCSFPPADHIILVGQGSFLTTFFHEMGHFFSLAHTQEGEDFRNGDNSACTNGCSCAMLIPGNNDGFADTLPDHECWNQDQLGTFNFGLPYASLNGFQQSRVDDVFFNLMSYHNADNRNRLTPDQLDRMTDNSNGSRLNVASGRTVWVDRNNGCILPNGDHTCGLFGGPFTSVTDGVNSAGFGDVVLIRSGNYNERTTFSKRLMLTATRGWVTIGAP